MNAGRKYRLNLSKEADHGYRASYKERLHRPSRGTLPIVLKFVAVVMVFSYFPAFQHDSKVNIFFYGSSL